MIYLFTGNSDYLIKEEVKKWKNRFLAKFGDFNLLEIDDITNIDKNFLSENFLGASFFSGNKLIIIKNIEKIEKDKDDTKKDFLISLLGKVPEQNIIVFTSLSLSEKSVLFNEISKVGEVKRFEIKNAYDTKLFLDKKYEGKIEQKALDKIISYKSNNLSKIILELDKIFITKDFIKEKDIIDIVVPELEETIFVFVDKFLNKDKTLFSDLDFLLSTRDDLYAFYNMLLGNLRTIFYISFFKNLGYGKNHIVSELSLGNRGFLVDKTYKMGNNEIISLYFSLVLFDKNMKLGKLIGSNFDDLRFELDKIFTNYLK